MPTCPMTALFPIMMLACTADPLSSAPSYPEKSRLLMYRDRAGREHSVTTPSDWAVRQQHVLVHLQEVMGPLPHPVPGLPLDVRVSEEVDTPTYIRRKISFVADKSDRVPAYLLVPKSRRGRLPAVLCLHQTVAI